MKKLVALSLVISGFGLMGLSSALAEVFKVPPLKDAVSDYAAIMAPAKRDELSLILHQIRDKGGSQIAVLTVPNLGDLTIEQASIKVVDEWKLGDKTKDNGILLTVAKEERRVRIEVGQGLEGVLTDAYSKRIIDQNMMPLFKEGRFDDGLFVGVFLIARQVNPEIDVDALFKGSLQNLSGRRGHSRSKIPSWPLTFFFLIAFIALSSFANRSRRFGGGRLGAGGSSGWGSGGIGGGGFSGGGGFGGGGGGFSGGGASGGW